MKYRCYYFIYQAPFKDGLVNVSACSEKVERFIKYTFKLNHSVVYSCCEKHYKESSISYEEITEAEYNLEIILK